MLLISTDRCIASHLNPVRHNLPSYNKAEKHEKNPGLFFLKLYKSMSPSRREPTVSRTLGPCQLAPFSYYIRESFNQISLRTQPRDKNNSVSFLKRRRINRELHFILCFQKCLPYKGHLYCWKNKAVQNQP